MSPAAALAHAVTQGDVPFVVAMTGRAAGTSWSGAAGMAAPGRAAQEDTVFRLFSMTKAVGSLAAMILVDRGRISLDTPVADILPDWDTLQVLDGWDGETPRLRRPRSVATLRHLASHRSGLEYEYWNPDVPRYLAATGGTSVFTGRRAGLLSYPLTFDPGTRWGYGASIDWLGQVVEAVDGRRIDAFCRDEIFGPLGMADTAFEPDGLEDRLAQVSARGADGAFAPMRLAPPRHPEFYGMGHALYGTAPDYLRFLRMVLGGGALDGVRVLSPEACAEMCADQLEGEPLSTMRTCRPAFAADVEMPPGTGHSAAFLTHAAARPGLRAPGSQSWAGLANTHFWLDPAQDLCAVWMTQTLPFLEPRAAAALEAFERAVYAGTTASAGV